VHIAKGAAIFRAGQETANKTSNIWYKGKKGGESNDKNHRSAKSKGIKKKYAKK